MKRTAAYLLLTLIVTSGTAYPADYCLMIENTDLRYLCGQKAVMSKNPDLRHLADRECDLIRNRDLYHYCRQENFLIKSDDWRAVAEGRCNQLTAKPDLQNFCRAKENPAR